MLKNILCHGIRLKKRMLWVCAIILLLMTTAVAQVDASDSVTNIDTLIINDYGLGVPFVKSWFGIWLFAIAGGIGATFIVIQDVDKHFKHPAAAKIFLGIFGGVTLCLLLVKDDPPSRVLISYAFIAALLAAPILQFLLASIAVKQNQYGILNAILSMTPIKFRFDDNKGGSHE